MNTSLRSAFRASLLGSGIVLLLGITAGLTTPAAGLLPDSPRHRDRVNQSLAAQPGNRTVVRTVSERRITQRPTPAQPKTNASLNAQRTETRRPAPQPAPQPAQKPAQKPTPETDADLSQQNQRVSHGPNIVLGPIVATEPLVGKRAVPPPPPATESRRPILFHTVPSVSKPESGSNANLVTRLASMERQLEQLTTSRLDQRADDVHRTTLLMQQLQQNQQLQRMEQQLQQLQASTRLALADTTQGTAKPTIAGGTNATDAPAADHSVLTVEPQAGESDRYTLRFHDADIREVLRMLGQLAGVNILPGKDVTGTVPSANLENVTVDEALDAILQSLGYVSERKGDFIHVTTKEAAEAVRLKNRVIETRVYRPNYISVNDLQALIAPILTPEIGKIAVTNPNESGIAVDNETAGGDSLSQRDALLIQDYEDVITEVDGIVAEMDVPPKQVVIEAKILSVRLTDKMKFGVNFALLNGSTDTLGVSGNGAQLNAAGAFPNPGNPNFTVNPVPAASEFIANTAGLKFGLIRGDVGLFLKALENISDTNLIAAPQLRVINKQKAELIIGDRLSYKTLAFNGTQTVENVNFLDVGTKLVIRPFISDDGQIRLEVHPERSSAVVDKQTGLPNQTTTEVTTNVMIGDQNTIVIGGLIEEQVSESYDRIPFLGALPAVGRVFRNKSESIDRVELIILITPRIVCDADAAEGAVAGYEFQHQADYFRDHLTPINRRNLARLQKERAEYYMERGDYVRARNHINLALQQSKNDSEALRLKAHIEECIHQQVHHVFHRSAVSETFPSVPPVPEGPLPPAPAAPSDSERPLAPGIEINPTTQPDSTTKPDATTKPAPPKKSDSVTKKERADEHPQ